MMPDKFVQAIRTLSRRPWTSAAAVCALGLGIGGASAIFSIVYGVLLHPLDYPSPDRLVRVYQTQEGLRNSSHLRLQAIWNKLPVSYLNSAEWSERKDILQGIGLWEDYDAVYSDGIEPLKLQGGRIDSSLLGVLGVRPLLGRGFEREEIERGEKQVLLSQALWQQLLGGDESALGSRLTLDGIAHEVIGVMPRGFRIADRTSHRFWVPLLADGDDKARRDIYSYRAVARLADGVSLSSAQERLSALALSQQERFPEIEAGTGVRIASLLESIVGSSRPLLGILMGAAAIAFLAALANATGLLLSQAESRRRETAIRLSLGAGRWRIFQQAAYESLAIATAAVALGLLVGVAGSQALLAWLPEDLPRRGEVSVAWSVLAFAASAALLSALAIAIVSTLRRPSSRLYDELREGRTQATRSSRLSAAAVVGLEIALALVLIAGAGLLVKSLVRLSAVDTGFRAEGVLTQRIELPPSRYGDSEAIRSFSRQLLQRLERDPSVQSAALTSRLPLAGLALVTSFEAAGRSASAPYSFFTGPKATMNVVSPGIFRTLGIPLLAGRAFDTSDRADGRRVVIVNETLAKTHWPQGDALGQAMILGAETEPFEVVGIIADVKHDGVHSETGNLIYRPLSQSTLPSLTLAVQAVGKPEAAASLMRRTIRGLDPALPLETVASLESLAGQALDAPKARVALAGVFAALALALSLLGVYSSMAFMVSRRVAEIGVRIALGASGRQVRFRILARTLLLAIPSLACGAALWLALSSALSNLLFEVAPADLSTLAAAAALTLASCLLAAYFPALRASRLDPVCALRSD